MNDSDKIECDVFRPENLVEKLDCELCGEPLFDDRPNLKVTALVPCTHLFHADCLSDIDSDGDACPVNAETVECQYEIDLSDARPTDIEEFWKLVHRQTRLESTVSFCGKTYSLEIDPKTTVGELKSCLGSKLALDENHHIFDNEQISLKAHDDKPICRLIGDQHPFDFKAIRIIDPRRECVCGRPFRQGESLVLLSCDHMLHGSCRPYNRRCPFCDQYTPKEYVYDCPEDAARCGEPIGSLLTKAIIGREIDSSSITDVNLVHDYLTDLSLDNSYSKTPPALNSTQSVRKVLRKLAARVGANEGDYSSLPSFLLNKRVKRGTCRNEGKFHLTSDESVLIDQNGECYRLDDLLEQFKQGNRLLSSDGHDLAAVSLIFPASGGSVWHLVEKIYGYNLQRFADANLTAKDAKVVYDRLRNSDCLKMCHLQGNTIRQRLLGAIRLGLIEFEHFTNSMLKKFLKQLKLSTNFRNKQEAIAILDSYRSSRMNQPEEEAEGEDEESEASWYQDIKDKTGDGDSVY
jgi:hypothetical protein